MNIHFHTPAQIPGGFRRAHESLSKALKNRFDVMLVESYQDMDFQVSWTQPYDTDKFRPYYKRKCSKQVIYTTFESEIVPDGWVDVINSREGLFTTSQWCKKIFEREGVKVSIDVIPHGIDVNEFPYLMRDWDLPFTFIWQGMHPDDRKGGNLVLRAFEKLNLKDARLVMKWVPLLSPRYYEKNKRIERVAAIWSQEKMLSVLSQCHCSVNPTGAEGFGLIPLEHMATGLPAIVTNWSGCADYIDSMYCYPLDIRGVNGQGRAEIDFDRLCELMEYCYNNRDSIMAKGRIASLLIHKAWTWERAALLFTNSLKNLEK